MWCKGESTGQWHHSKEFDLQLYFYVIFRFNTLYELPNHTPMSKILRVVFCKSDFAIKYGMKVDMFFNN